MSQNTMYEKELRDRLEFIKPKYKESDIHSFEKYISDHPNEVKEILNNNENVNLIAPMNSGKTYSIIKIAEELKREIQDINFIIIVPLVSIAQQKQEEMLREETIDLGFVHGRGIYDGKEQPPTSDAEILAMVNARKTLICVYDQLPNIILSISSIPPEHTGSNFNLKNYTLIIDEAHNLVTQSNFRLKAIKPIVDNLDRFRNVIYMTGTPEGAIINDYKWIKFERREKSVRQNITLITYKNDLISKLAYHILTYKQHGKAVILLDSRNKLEKLKKALMNNSIRSVPEERIWSLSKDARSEADFVEMLNMEKIPDNAEFILTTRVIADGVNIKNYDVTAVYTVLVDDYLLKRQFLSRFRHGFSNAYEFIPFTKNPINPTDVVSMNNFQKYLVDCIKDKEREQSRIDSRIDPNHYKRFVNKAYKEVRKGDCFFWDTSKEMLYLSKERVKHYFLCEFNRLLYANPDWARLYYEEIAGYSCQSLVFEVQNEFNDFECDYSEDYIKFYKEYLTAYYEIYECKRFFHRYSNMKFYCHELDCEEFYNDNASGYSRSYTEVALEFLSEGFPLDFAASIDKLLLRNNSKAIRTKLKCLRLNALYRAMRLSYCEHRTIIVDKATYQLRLIGFLVDSVNIGSYYCKDDLIQKIKEYSDSELSVDLSSEEAFSYVNSIFDITEDRKVKKRGLNCSGKYVLTINGLKSARVLFADIANLVNQEFNERSKVAILNAAERKRLVWEYLPLKSSTVDYICLNWNNISTSVLFTLLRRHQEISVKGKNEIDQEIVRCVSVLSKIREREEKERLDMEFIQYLIDNPIYE